MMISRNRCRLVRSIRGSSTCANRLSRSRRSFSSISWPPAFWAYFITSSSFPLLLLSLFRCDCPGDACSFVVIIVSFSYTSLGTLSLRTSCRFHVSTGTTLVPSDCFHLHRSNTGKGDEHHGTLHDSICLYRRGVGNAGEKPTRPERTHQGTGAEARWAPGRSLLLFWRVRRGRARRNSRRHLCYSNKPGGGFSRARQSDQDDQVIHRRGDDGGDAQGRESRVPGAIRRVDQPGLSRVRQGDAAELFLGAPALVEADVVVGEGWAWGFLLLCFGAATVIVRDLL